MQSLVLTVSLLLMCLVAALFIWAVAGSSGQAPGEGANRRRSLLIWGLTAAGIVVSIASLRDWPHAIAAEDEGVVVKVSGAQWYWDIDVEEVPLGKPIIFHVTSEDVNHGMGVYDEDTQLLFQTQGMPGYVNKVSYTFDRPGTYRILCMELCGVAHHDMISEFTVVAEQ